MAENPQAGGVSNTNESTAEDALVAWGELKFREDSMGRDAEEREWQEAALFFQRRQWLEWKEGENRYVQIKPDKNKPRPMPVSNYFAKTVNACANSLGSAPVRVIATPKSDDAETRRAADYAEIAKDAIDIESGMRQLNPLLAKHEALWGIGVTVDQIDTEDNQEALDEQEMESAKVTGCLDCGNVSEQHAAPMEDDSVQQQAMPCPACGSMQTAEWTRQNPVTTSQYISGKGKIKTEVRPIFEIYLPRNVQNGNLSPRVLWRHRVPLSKARAKYGERAEGLKSDDPATNTSETRFDILRTLSSYTFAERLSSETTTLSEMWVQWDELPTRLQDKIEEEYEGSEEGDELPQNVEVESAQDLPDDEESESENPELQQMKQGGLFFIWSQGKMLQWGPNSWVDPDTEEKFNPFTFFHWELDPANVYNKGASTDLVPLQKRLNRLDSLIELAMMSNASGKWIWPTTQDNMKPPNGDPVDVIRFDPLGDGKMAPQFVQPSPIHGAVWQYRASILQDFQEIGMTQGVQTGSASDQAAFRTVAYLGAKASEQLDSQRYLWESAHCLRYKKVLALAKLYWDDERSAKIAGPNGKYLFQSFTGQSLRGLYEIDYVKNSSVPKTTDEKLQMIQTMVAGGLVDMSDPSTREYLYDLSNLDGVNLAQELQFRKAERDLDTVKRGEMPIESPFQDWQIELKIVGNFTLTEEFEALDPTLQSYVLAFAEYCNQKVTMINQQAQQQSLMQMAAKSAASAPPGDPNNKSLAKIPGETIAPGGAEGAASKQGDQFAQSMGI